MAWDALSMMSITAPEQISGLGNNEKDILVELFEIYNNHFSANKLKNKYYEGKVTLSDVNIGIAIPKGLKDIGIGCSWGAKTVDVQEFQFHASTRDDLRFPFHGQRRLSARKSDFHSNKTAPKECILQLK